MKNIVECIAYMTLPGLLAACSPVQHETSASGKSAVASPPITITSTPPSDWRPVSFVSGLSVAVPPTAKVAYPQGVDSSLLEITGQSFSLTFDDYGPFTGNGTMRLAGQRADEITRVKDDCRHRVVYIELPKDWGLASCAPEEKACKLPRAKVVMNSLCRGAAACGTVDTIIGSASLAPEPHPPFSRPDPAWRPPEQPLCSFE